MNSNGTENRVKGVAGKRRPSPTHTGDENPDFVHVYRGISPTNRVFFHTSAACPVAPHQTACHYPKLSLGHGKISRFYQREMRVRHCKLMYPKNHRNGRKHSLQGRVEERQACCARSTDRRGDGRPSGRSIPKLCGSPYAVKATYNLFKHEEATPENIQAGHRAVVLREMQRPGIYLCLEDTTELSWSGKQAIAGVGPIGNAAGLQASFCTRSWVYAGKTRRRQNSVSPSRCWGEVTSNNMRGRHVVSRESRRKNGANGPESRKSGPKPVSVSARQKACGGSGWPIAKPTSMNTW